MIDIESINKNNRIVAWHGSQKWQGLPEIKEHKKGTYEYGPGIYFTNKVETAQKYSKGSGSLMLMEIEVPNLLTNKHKIDINEAISFYDSCYRMKNKKGVLNDLQRNIIDGQIAVETMINCGVNNESLTGSHGPALAEWLKDKGFDGIIGRQTYDKEEWLIMFNPKMIKRYTKVSARDLDIDDYFLPSFSAQIDKIDLGRVVDLDEKLNGFKRTKSFKV